MKCPKCNGVMEEGVGSTPRGGILFWGQPVGNKITEWLTAGGTVDNKTYIKILKCKECGYLESYAK
ncbi:hypothetical protein HYT02_05310 [Candidatus Gottesmanbacteria bacterium]|nr:hypothetical protein [Candidatus Gottesmanbacteria bacterium]